MYAADGQYFTALINHGTLSRRRTSSRTWILGLADQCEVIVVLQKASSEPWCAWHMQVSVSMLA